MMKTILQAASISLLLMSLSACGGNAPVVPSGDATVVSADPSQSTPPVVLPPELPSGNSPPYFGLREGNGEMQCEMKPWLVNDADRNDCYLAYMFDPSAIEDLLSPEQVAYRGSLLVGISNAGYVSGAESFGDANFWLESGSDVGSHAWWGRAANGFLWVVGRESLTYLYAYASRLTDPRGVPFLMDVNAGRVAPFDGANFTYVQQAALQPTFASGYGNDPRTLPPAVISNATMTLAVLLLAKNILSISHQYITILSTL